MASLIRPNNVKVVTQDGEVQVTIALELTINLNSNGLNVSAGNVEAQPANLSGLPKKPKEEKVNWEIPDFDAFPKVDFGKKE